MQAYLLDSDVIIWYLRGRKDTVNQVRKLVDENVELCCSVLSLVEVLRGAKKEEAEQTEAFLDLLSKYPVYAKEATLAAIYQQKYRNQGIGLVDAIIAATCVINGLTLVTYNGKHFPMPEVKRREMAPVNEQG